MTNKIFLICATARSGKDTMTNCFVSEFAKKGILAKRYAFADELKKQLNPLLLMNLGISAFTEDAEEKALIRPMLLTWGQVCRRVDNDYWCKIVEEKISSEPYPHIAVISDFRYPNEKKYLGGESLHITRYDDSGQPFPPVGNDEEKYNEILKGESEYTYSWNNFNDNLSECYYNGKQLFDKLFAVKIPEWQKTFPLPTTT